MGKQIMADVSIALNRFGLGARPDDPLSEEPRKWLIGQLDAFEPNPPAIAALPGRQQIAGNLAADIEQTRMLRRDMREAQVPSRPTSPTTMDGDKGAPSNAPADTPALQEARRIARRKAQDL